MFQAAEYKTIKLQAKPHLLYKPGLNTPNPEANHNFKVLDRVVVVSDTFSVSEFISLTIPICTKNVFLRCQWDIKVQ